MPYGVNLDICIARTAAPFPNILRNLMINDYLRGLQAGQRMGAEEFLGRFADDSSARVAATRAHNRIIRQSQASRIESLTDPRGAALAYSGWCNKWYLGIGRIKSLINALFVHANLAKKLLEDSTIWNIDVEKDIIRSVVSTIKSGMKRKENSDEAIAFYMNARRSNTMDAMLHTWREHIKPKWGGTLVHGDEIERFDDSTGTRYPAVVRDNFFDTQGGYLISWFGDVASGHDHEGWRSCPGSLFQRAFEESLAKLISRARLAGGDFDYRSTYVHDFVDDGCYSFVVCMLPQIEIFDLPHQTLDPSMQALEGIALLQPTRPIEECVSAIHSLGVDFEREFGHAIPNIQHVFRKATTDVILPLRTDLYRCLLFSGIVTMGFAVDFREITDGDRLLLMRPIRKCISHNEKAAFWPRTSNKVPDTVIKVIRDINDQAIKWKRDLFGRVSASRGSDSQANTSMPALSDRAVQSEEIDEIRLPRTSASVERRENPTTDFRDQEQKELPTPVGDAPDEVQTALTNEHYMLGAAILLILLFITFRQ